jgi:integrase
MPMSFKAVPFARFSRSILGTYDTPAHAPRTLAKLRHVLGLLASLEGIESTADLTTENLARFVRWRSAQVCPNTVRSELAYLSAACTFAAEEGWLEHAPRFARIRPRPSPAARPRAHSIEEIARLLEVLRARASSWEGGRLLALASLVAYTALRRDEALFLRVEDVNLTMGRIRIVARPRLKTLAAAAEVPICPELAELLAAWLPRCGSEWVFPCASKPGRPWVGGAYGTRPTELLREVGLELGIEGLTLASLRHTWATWARRRWNLSALEVQEVLRHTSPRTQELYLHPDPDPSAIVRAVKGVSYSNGS